jgi:hypothetical protein
MESGRVRMSMADEPSSSAIDPSLGGKTCASLAQLRGECADDDAVVVFLNDKLSPGMARHRECTRQVRARVFPRA